MGGQRTVAKTFGYVFVIIGLLGFVPNPIVSAEGFFEVNTLHNVVHLASGAVALAAGYTRETYAQAYNVGFGAVYAIVTVLGFLGTAFLVDLLALNMADNVLHLVIAASLLAAGLTIETRDRAAAPA